MGKAHNYAPGPTGFGAHPSGRNMRNVWTIPTRPFSAKSLGFHGVDHFAAFPPALVEPCVKAGTKQGDVVLDPFFGAGTVGLVAVNLGRRYLGIELNPDYVRIAEARIAQAREEKTKREYQVALPLAGVAPAARPVPETLTLAGMNCEQEPL